MLFSNLGSRQVVADFSSGALSTDAGALLLRRDPLLATACNKTDPLGEDRLNPADRGLALAAPYTLNRLELSNNKRAR
jgi:hypothetical protein